MLRSETFKNDVDEAQKLCKETESPFKGFNMETDGSLHLVVQHGEFERRFMVHPFDYPLTTSVFDCDDPDFIITGEYRVLQVLHLLADKMHMSPFGHNGRHLRSPTDNSITNPSCRSSVDNVHSKDFVGHSLKDPSMNSDLDISSINIDLQDNLTNKEDTDADSDDEDGWLSFVSNHEQSTHLHKDLLHDLREVNQVWRERFGLSLAWDAAQVKYHAGLDNCEIILRLYINSCSLDLRTALAWGFRRNDTLVIRFTEVPAASYREITLDKGFSVHVSTLAKAASRIYVAQQLEKLLETFVKRNWSHLLDDHRNSQNIWLETMLYIEQRLPTLNEHCIVCDAKQDCDMMLPTVCSRELCVFSYESLGVMFDIPSHLNCHPEVVDLLLSLVRCAGYSYRAEQIFDPYPSLVDPCDSEVLKINPQQKDFQALRKLLDKLPCLPRLLNLLNIEEQASLNKAITDHCDSLVFPLIRWVLTSNRTCLVHLTKKQQLSFMETPHQFLMMLDSPAKEVKFRDALQANGGKSIFAFHGSPIENWHSILRKGLMNASGTKLQINGAAYGNGIYLSPLWSVAQQYMTRRYHDVAASLANFSNLSNCPGYQLDTAHSCTGTELKKFIGLATSGACRCIAICEIVDSASLQRHENRYMQLPAQSALSSVWVETNPAHVCTRFLFVFPDGKSHSAEVDLSAENNANQVRRSMCMIHRSCDY